MSSIRIALAASCLAAIVPASAAAATHGQTVQLEHYAAPAAAGVVGPDDAASFDATLPNGRRVTPVGISTMVGEFPLGSALSPDGRFLIVSDDDERSTGSTPTPYSTARGSDKVNAGYRVTVVRTEDMAVVDHKTPPANPTRHPAPSIPGITQRDNIASAWLGVAVKDNGPGLAPTVYISGGPNNIVSAWRLNDNGTLTPAAPSIIAIPVPQDRTNANYGMAAPGGLTLSPDGSRLFVVNNNANSVVTVDTATNQVIAGSERPVGYFPYTAAVAPSAGKLFVTNWGITERRFGGEYLKTAATGSGNGSPCIGGFAVPPCTFDAFTHLFANPLTDPQRSSSVSVLDLAGGNSRAISLARPIDGLEIVGGTHPSAMTVAASGDRELLYVADANEDRVAVIDAQAEGVVAMIDLPQPATRNTGGPAFGLYPDALALSPDHHTLFVAEAGLNAVAVFDVTDPTAARYEGAIPTGWYPSSLQVAEDGRALFILNAKGFGAPLPYDGHSPAVNLLFGSAQKVDLTDVDLIRGDRRVRNNTYREVSEGDAQGLRAAERNVRHVIFVLRENKTYDSYLGADTVLNERGADGEPAFAAEWDPWIPNTKALAEEFATGDRTYADSEESNAGHQYALAGTSTDFSQKTLLARGQRPLINVKNEDPEDYPLRGYLFNAAAREGVSFRDYGDMLRLSGYDEGQNPNGCQDDPANRACTNGELTPGPIDATDTTSPVKGLGGRYAETTPALKVLAGHIDPNYPGWSLRITDRRREREFERDFSAQLRGGTAPALTFVWLPQDHTGTACCSPANGKPVSPEFQVADNDAAVGRLVEFVSHSPIWRHTAIFVAEDDAQGESDHVSAHRTVTTVISPWARRRTVPHTLISTASITKTVDELLGLAPTSMGDQLATDMRDWFTASPDYTPYTARAFSDPPTTAAGLRITELGSQLDTSGPDTDSFRQARLSHLAAKANRLSSRRDQMPENAYRRRQQRLYDHALAIVRDDPAPDADG